MIRITVLDERSVVGQDFKDMFVISIVSPYREHPKIEGSNVWRFHFHDVTEEYFLEKQNVTIRPMGKAIAESIADLAMKNRDDDRWVIHCEAGISRSPGVAIGLAKYIKTIPSREKLIELFPMYNKHVCKLIEEAMKAQVEEIEKELRISKED